eukprot:TRINITY_DN94477_c0_g1_i1.p2 TRINITY_DN94477_c0_g1~~TRINITY_DN94477_c0_g1_i1.p2  ORF type:complete len:156 (-),score=29.31 TRINITY_DN94477_c0_g1_i1:73-540(-)
MNRFKSNSCTAWALVFGLLPAVLGAESLLRGSHGAGELELRSSSADCPFGYCGKKEKHMDAETKKKVSQILADLIKKLSHDNSSLLSLHSKAAGRDLQDEILAGLDRAAVATGLRGELLATGELKRLKDAIGRCDGAAQSIKLLQNTLLSLSGPE